MKKRIIFILALLLIQTILAIDIQLSKESYYPQETLQAEITGNFISLNSDNILIYKQGTPRPMPVISDLTKQENKYYFYAILPNQIANFSLKIEDSQYIETGRIKSDTISKDFIIESPNQSYLSINPGFILTNKDFSVKVKSLYGNSDITTKLQEQTQSIFLIQEIEETINFPLPASSTNLKINNYNIPVFIFDKKLPIPEEKTDLELEFIPPKLTGKITSEENYFFKIILRSLGDKNITNLKLSSDLNITLTPNTTSVLEPMNPIIINITLSVPKIENNISGEIIAEFDNKKFKLPVFFEITSDKTEINLSGTGVTETLSCSEMGDICTGNEECTGEIGESLEGPCCKGECILKEESDYSWIFGIILIIVVIIIIIFVIRKIKKQKPKTSKDIFREKSDAYKKRMHPEEKFKETRGSLENV